MKALISAVGDKSSRNQKVLSLLIMNCHAIPHFPGNGIDIKRQKRKFEVIVARYLIMHLYKIVKLIFSLTT